jgi:hypothetical protein
MAKLQSGPEEFKKAFGSGAPANCTEMRKGRKKPWPIFLRADAREPAHACKHESWIVYIRRFSLKT